MKVKRAIYKDNDGCYIYSTTDIALSNTNNPDPHFVQKYVDFEELFIEDNVKEIEQYKIFDWMELQKECQIIQINSEVDERIVNMEFIPFYLLVDESKFYVDITEIKKQMKKEQDSISSATKIAQKGFN